MREENIFHVDRKPHKNSKQESWCAGSHKLLFIFSNIITYILSYRFPSRAHWINMLRLVSHWLSHIFFFWTMLNKDKPFLSIFHSAILFDFTKTDQAMLDRILFEVIEKIMGRDFFFLSEIQQRLRKFYHYDKMNVSSFVKRKLHSFFHGKCIWFTCQFHKMME